MNTSPEIRRTVATVLAGSGDAEAFEVLSEGLRAPDPEVQMATLDVLRDIGTPQTVRFIVPVLESDTLMGRFSGCGDPGNDRGRRGVPPLLNVVTRENDLLVITSAKALGDLGSKKAIGPLRTLTESESSDVRRAAEEALEAIG